MHKIIHSKFELDLTSYNLTSVNENYWFSDHFFTKYTYPQKMKLTEDKLKMFSYFLDDTNQFNQTLFNVTYIKGSKVESAIFEITGQVGLILDFEIRFGFDELPNWNKKLRDLPLEEVSINNVYSHAKTIITQTWPAVNYNYPQIHTDKYDVYEDTWSTFKKIINNYVDGEFLKNTSSVEDFANRNIMQPLPYVLHVLKVLFADAGYTLKGSITTNEMFQKLLLFADVDYFNELIDRIIVFDLYSLDFTSETDIYFKFNNQFDLIESSRYRISGFVTLYTDALYQNNSVVQHPYILIKYKNTVLLQESNPHAWGYGSVDVDITFDTDGDLVDPQLLTFELVTHKHDDQTAGIYDHYVIRVEIEKIVEVIDAPSEIIIEHNVQLKNAVPDITGGALIEIIKNLANINLYTEGKDIYMDFIEDEINYKNAVNLSGYEKSIEEVPKEFKSRKSYLLKYKDVDVDSYVSKVVLQGKESVEYSEANADEYTDEIEIEALPLPLKMINSIDTAYAVENGGDNSVYFVMYAGLNTEGLNLTEKPTSLKIENIHSRFHKKWLAFRLNSVYRKWDFIMFEEELEKVKKKIFAYKQFHIVKNVEETQLKEDVYSVEIEMESLP